MHLLVEVHLRWLTFYTYIIAYLLKNVNSFQARKYPREWAGAF